MALGRRPGGTLVHSSPRRTGHTGTPRRRFSNVLVLALVVGVIVCLALGAVLFAALLALLAVPFLLPGDR